MRQKNGGVPATPPPGSPSSLADQDSYFAAMFEAGAGGGNARAAGGGRYACAPHVILNAFELPALGTHLVIFWNLNPVTGVTLQSTTPPKASYRI